MSTVLVHNNSFGTEQQARRQLGTAPAIRREHWWNLWRVRQQPYQLIEDGMPVVLLNTWPRGDGELGWLVWASDVHTEQFADKAAAIRAIARWAGQRPRWVLDNTYSDRKPDDAGTVIYWRATPVRHLGLPRPNGLEVGRNGWAVTDTVALAKLGVDIRGDLGGRPRQKPRVPAPKPPRRSAGQGRRVDQAVKDAIEDRAVTVATRWCHTQRWSGIHTTGDTESWDLEGVDRAGTTHYVEVKGTTGGPAKVEVTAGEVKAAREHEAAHVIVIVHGIEVDVTDPALPVASKGTVVAYDPWAPRRDELTDLRYTWRPAKR